MPGSVRVGGAWKPVSGASARVGGAWKTVTDGWTRVGGVWKQWYQKAFGWTRANAPESRAWSSAIYAPIGEAKYFIAGNSNVTTGSTSNYYYSPDGTNWTEGSFPSAVSARNFAFSGSRLFLGLASSADGLYSDNGTTWTFTTIWASSSATSNDSLWDGSRFVVLGAPGGVSRLHYSTDAISWTGYNTLAATSIGYDGTHYVLVSTGTSAQRKTDITSSLFTNAAISNGNRTWVGNNGSIWVAPIGGSTSYATSPNGLAPWTNRTLPIPFGATGTGLRSRMFISEGVFYYFARLGTTSNRTVNIVSSPDGITWTQVASTDVGNVSVPNNIQAWAIGEGRFIGVGTSEVTNQLTNGYILGE